MSARAARILVVDDDYDTAFAIAIMLKEQGFSVDWVADPKTALSSFCRGKYELAVLDARMPDLDGFALYRSISKIDPDLKVCFLTASYETPYNDLHSNLANIGSSPFLRKPVSLGNLVQTINSILCEERN